MKQNRIRQNRIFTHRFPIAGEIYRVLGIILCFLGLGLLATGLYMAPKLATLGLVFIGLGIPLVFLIWQHPELGLVALIFLTSSLLPSDIVDLRLPIGGGLELRDLLLLAMLGMLILRSLSTKSLIIPWWSVGAPLIIFLCLSVFSGFYALFFEHVESNWTLSDLRTLAFYCVFFITAWAITSKQQLAIVIAGLFIVADLIAGIIILQEFLGANHTLLTAMSYTNWAVSDIAPAEGSGSFGVVRIMPPGVVLVYFSMVMAFCLMAFTSQNRHLRAYLGFQFLYLNFAILLTYTRALWIATAIALGLAIIALFPTYKAHLIRYTMIGILILALLLTIGGTVMKHSSDNPELVIVLIDRFSSILTPEQTMQSYSLQWRVFEQEQALISISKHPLIGVGLGNSYRKVTTLQGEDSGWLTSTLAAGQLSRFTRFLHNSYLSLAVKMGLIGLGCFLWFCMAMLIGGVFLYRNTTDRQSKAVVLAVVTSFVGLMFWSFFHQHFIQTESTATVGLLAGLGACIHNGISGGNNDEQLRRRLSTRIH
jgi:hypothetical protein